MVFLGYVLWIDLPIHLRSLFTYWILLQENNAHSQYCIFYKKNHIKMNIPFMSCDRPTDCPTFRLPVRHPVGSERPRGIRVPRGIRPWAPTDRPTDRPTVRPTDRADRIRTQGLH